jgi:Flp pilus assembly protein TadD/ADP-heptose:LPS heptosyltransferase
MSFTFPPIRFHAAKTMSAVIPSNTAVGLLRKLDLAIDPGNTSLWYQLFGTLAREAGRGDLAVEMFEKALQTRGTTQAEPSPKSWLSPNGASGTLVFGVAPNAATQSETAPAEPTADDAERIFLRAFEDFQQGKFEDAEKHLREANRLRSGYFEAIALLGTVLGKTNRLAEAEACFRLLVELRPLAVDARADLGMICLQRGRAAEAEVIFRAALLLSPDHGELMYRLGRALAAQGRPNEAEPLYREALRRDPTLTEAHFSLGLVCKDRGDFATAATAFREATRLDPNHVDAHNNLGIVLEDDGKPAEAIEAYRHALRLDPESPEIHCNLGVALAALDRLDEAELEYREAMRRKPANPIAHNNLGNALRQLGRLEEAEAELKESIRLHPAYSEAHNNLAIVHIQQGRRDEAARSYEEALRLKPDYPEAHLNRALYWLGNGDFARGWAEYEWRVRGRNFNARHSDRSRWDGSSFSGKTLVIHTEQGAGDSLQFIRFAQDAKARGGEVIVECPEPLADLFRSVAGIDRVWVRGKEAPAFDLQIPLMSLPHALGLSEITSRHVPYLAPDAKRQAYWSRELAGLEGMRVGIVWQGNPQHKGDRQRSAPLKAFAPLAAIPGVVLCALQKDAGRDQLRNAGFRVVDPGNRLQNSWSDTAALVSQLDLVIGVDTGVIHLAAGLGKPTWVALPAAADWRWLQNREDSPWYGAARLFRQSRRGDWQELFARIEHALRQLAEQPRPERVGSVEPQSAEEFHQTGSSYFRNNKIEAALEFFRKAVDAKPDRTDYLNSLGAAYAKLGKLPEAEAAFRKGLEASPGSMAVLGNLALCLMEQDKKADAEAIYATMVEKSPRSIDLRMKHGAVLRSLKKKKEAETAFQEVLSIQADHVDALNNLGILAEDQNKPAEAEAYYRKALKAAPESAEIHSNLGVALAAQDRLADAELAYRESIRIKPKSAAAYNNLGNTLRMLGRVEDAEASLKEAIRLKADYSEAHNNLGVVLVQAGRIDEGVRSYDEAVRLNPSYAEAHLNRSLAMLVQGDFAAGWEEYDWRWKGRQLKPRFTSHLLWQGEPLEGKTILLHAEQGLGDAIQFVRYAPLVKARGARVLVECHEPLATLFKSCEGVDDIIVRNKKPPAFDIQCPFLNLPRIFSTTLDSIPAKNPYLTADPGRIAHWARELAGLEGIRIGFTWQGNPQHKGDRLRSVPLERFSGLAKVPGVIFCSLQKHHGRDQLGKASFRVEDFGSVLEGMGDTAALMANLDLVISVDTSVVHLAGALGVPVWVALPFAPDWRWMRGIEHSPWYPTLRHFRQPRTGEWSDVFRRLEESLREFRPTRTRPVAAPPETAAEHQSLGSLLFRRGKFEEAAASFERAVALEPSKSDHHNSLGAAYAKLRRLAEAEASFRRVLEIEPRSHAALGNLGLCCFEQGNREAAESTYRSLVALAPKAIEPKIKLANVLRSGDKKAEAIELFREVVRLQPKHVDALNTLGILLEETGKPTEAVEVYRQALAHDPKSAEIHSNLGVAYAGLDKNQEAEASYREAIRLKPRSAAAHNNLGNVLRKRGKGPEAEAVLREAIRLQPSYPEAYNNLGIVLSNQGKIDAAIDCYRKALELRPNYPEAHNNFAILLADQHRPEEALREYDDAIRKRPDYAEARLNRALTYLVQGDFERGWPEYEWRWKPPLWKGDSYSLRRWTGASLDGKMLLLRAEQGLGDTVQFVRFAGRVKQRFPTCWTVLECQEPLADLLGTCPDLDEIVVRGKKLPDFDFQVPLLSIPAALGLKGDAYGCPMPYLFPPPGTVERWHDELNAHDGIRVGVVWQGNPGYKGDKNRSVKLEQFEALAKVPGVRLISLQKGAGQDQVAANAKRVPIVDLASRIKTFTDTAAAILNLDLVISVDTAVAHLAGALAAPVWTLLPFANDWRWLRGRDDTPWYPSMRLLRQQAPRQWDPVFARIVEMIRKFRPERAPDRSAALAATP